jgi:HTH-type transcriptional repressor of NAD biosynthesis genes
MIKIGFTFGKFLPFHKGHKGLIKFALQNCDILTVYVCCNEKEKISGEQRKKWIDYSFPFEGRLKVKIFNYNINELSDSSESNEDVSKKWANAFIEQELEFGEHSNILFTSEPYGEYVSQFMAIDHKYYDVSRHINPVSASSIRNNMELYWNYLPKLVKKDLVRNVVILGTESTGKTSMCEDIDRYNPSKFHIIRETGREIVRDSNAININNLYQIAHKHGKRIKKASTKYPLLLIDTDINTTNAYARFCFNTPLYLHNINTINTLYLYLNNDVRYVQDGTRLSKENRDALDLVNRQVMKESNIPFIEITGNYKERYDKVMDEIENFLSIDMFYK